MTHPIDDLMSARDQQLRRRIGWLCQVMRAAALAYAAWVLAAMIWYWGSEDLVLRFFRTVVQVDLAGISAGRRLAGFAVHFAVWLFAAAACFSTWRLFTLYLRGEIFSLGAARWLRRIGLFGLISQLGDIASRPLISLIVSGNEAPGHRMVAVFFNPSDLLNVLFLTGFVALAHVFTVAAEIADEHSQII